MVDANRIQCAEERYKQTFWSRSQLIRLINKWLWCLCIVSTTIQNHHHHHSENYENIQNKKYRDRRKSRNMHAYHAITNRWSIKVVCYAYKIDNSKCLPHGNGILCYESNTEQRDWYKKMETTACIKKMAARSAMCISLCVIVASLQLCNRWCMRRQHTDAMTHLIPHSRFSETISDILIAAPAGTSIDPTRAHSNKIQRCIDVE